MAYRIPVDDARRFGLGALIKEINDDDDDDDDDDHSH